MKEELKLFQQLSGKFVVKDTIPNEEMVVMLTTDNYIKRVHPSAFRRQGRGGRGKLPWARKKKMRSQSFVTVKSR